MPKKLKIRTNKWRDQGKYSKLHPSYFYYRESLKIEMQNKNVICNNEKSCKTLKTLKHIQTNGLESQTSLYNIVKG